MIRDLASYLWKNKLWWMAPPIIVIVLFTILVAVSAVSPISPFMYMLF
ncbi:hypothetical protein HY947_06405 [Candidatus Gottesmanbacteria bacterium]|nr:hypothetical protein [Candidatus Gottesmanbacteria bacterium]